MESAEAVTGSVRLKRDISGAFREAPVPCSGCSSQHTRKVTARDNSALGSSLAELPSHAGQGSAPACRTAGPGRAERRSQRPGKGTGMLQLWHTDAATVLALSSSFLFAPEPGAVELLQESSRWLSQLLLLSRVSLAWSVVTFPFLQ